MLYFNTSIFKHNSVDLFYVDLIYAGLIHSSGQPWGHLITTFPQIWLLLLGHERWEHSHPPCSQINFVSVINLLKSPKIDTEPGRVVLVKRLKKEK